MTTAEIRRRLVRIGAEARQGDHEAAHGDEDRLFVDVLRAVAAGKAGAVEAQTALASTELQFPRRRS